VEDGWLVGSGPNNVSHLYTRRDDYRDFHLRFTVQVNDKGNSGVYFHSSFGPTALPDLPLPRGYNLKLNREWWGGMFIDRPPLIRRLSLPFSPDRPVEVDIIALGRDLTVKVDGRITVEHNDGPRSYPRGRLALQQHGAETVVKFRNIEIREIPAEPQVGDKLADGFESLFNERDLTGWKILGPQGWRIVDGEILATAGTSAGWLMSDQEFSDFELKLEYRMSEGCNSGVFLRAWPDAPLNGAQLFEIQLQDDKHVKYKDLKSDQKTGAIYNCLAPTAIPDSPIERWNQLTVFVKQRTVKVWINDKQILTGNLDKLSRHFEKFPGLKRARGHIGLQLNKGNIKFRNIQVRELH
ncbi:MAG: DUF1080 domain-containing protein, partial [Planctomycetes bacterium]|nr:DUF1080 domain-containing protein [Planctomycetota bacterium]